MGGGECELLDGVERFLAASIGAQQHGVESDKEQGFFFRVFLRSDMSLIEGFFFFLNLYQGYSRIYKMQL